MRREDSPGRPQRDVTQPRLKPGQAWVCGYSELGQSCQSGPTCDGKCGRSLLAASDTGALENVANAAGEQATIAPCIPRRSFIARRQSLRLNLAILTGGLLMLCMALPSREKTFVPGDLSSKHAQILENTLAAERCGLCHPTSHSPSSLVSGTHDAPNQVAQGLLASARRLIENDGRQDQLCMQCHKGHLPNAIHRDPHDLSPETWRKLRQPTDAPWQLVSTRTSSPEEGATPEGTSTVEGNISKTSCAMCHNEHHGRGFDIKLISDSRCQACHQRQFESLASGHPEFKDFPIDRPRGLAFSHSRHALDHFAKKNRDFDCKACHVTTHNATTGDQVVRALSFEHACASCHDAPIRAATVDGWAAIQLPSIDANAAQPESDFADWPETARFGYDGFVSPVLRGLLMSDPEAAQALAQLPASGKIVDISSISGRREEVAKTLAIATRRLIQETAREGQAAWVARLQKVTRAHLERDLTEQELGLIASMAAGMPPDVFRHAESQWMRGPQPLTENGPTRGQLVRTAPAQPVAGPTSNDDLLSSDELLGTAAPERAKADDDLLSQPESALLDSTSDSSLESSLHTTLETTPELKAPTPIKGATHLTGGGWYVDQNTLAIRYMPVGHADATLSAWSLWWSLLESHRSVTPTDPSQRIAQRLSLANSALDNQGELRIADTVPGKCTECHQSGNIAVRFTSSLSPFRPDESFEVPERDATVREFTKFRHTAHLTLPALSDCRYCHQEKRPVSSTVHSSNYQHPATSEFASMNLTQCAACHRPGGANDRCVQCHNYHVTSPK